MRAEGEEMQKGVVRKQYIKKKKNKDLNELNTQDNVSCDCKAVFFFIVPGFLESCMLILFSYIIINVIIKELTSHLYVHDFHTQN